MRSAKEHKPQQSRVITNSNGSRCVNKANLDRTQYTFLQMKPSEDNIRERAYYIWIKKGRPQQTKELQDEDWALATMEETQKEQYNIAYNKFSNTIDVHYPLTINYSSNIKRTIKIGGKSGDDFDNFNQALFDAIPIWEKMNIILPEGLEIYFTDDTNVKEAAYHFDNGKIIMTSKMFEKPSSVSYEDQVRGGYSNVGITGVSNQVSNDKISYGAAVLTHELGHILHKLYAPKQFTEMQLNPNAKKFVPNIAKDISYYAAMSTSNFEIVAEVFTGLVHGVDFKCSTINEYLRLGGVPDIVLKRYPYFQLNSHK